MQQGLSTTCFERIHIDTVYKNHRWRSTEINNVDLQHIPSEPGLCQGKALTPVSRRGS